MRVTSLKQIRADRQWAPAENTKMGPFHWSP